MAFLVISPAPIKTISLLLLTFLIWHGGSGVSAVSVVTNLKAPDITSTSVLLTWVVPNDTNAASYTYFIEVSTNKISVENITTGANANNQTVKNLKPGVTYDFKVYTNDSNNLSTATSISETTIPSTVTNLKSGTITATNVTLSWATPTDQNATTYTYVITISNHSPPNVTTEVGANSYTITGLKPGVNYTFAVHTQTINSVLSLTSVPVTATTIPSTVTNLKTGNITTTNVTLSWTTPTDQNATTYTYDITVSNHSPETITTSTGATSYTITGLKPGVNYTFTVRAKTINSVLSAASETVPATTLPSSVTGLTIGTITTTNVTLSWTIPTDQNETTYTYVITISNHSPPNVTTEAGAKSYIFTDLKPGENYIFAVHTQTINSVLSAAPEPVTATTKPSPVSGLAITSRTTTTVTLSWNTPNDSNKVTYTYVITVSIHNPGTIPTAANANSYTVTGLNPGVNYTFTVHTSTINLVQSIAFAFINGTTIPSPVPSTGLVNRNTSSITIEWTTPSDVRVKEYKYKVSINTGVIISTINSNYTATDLQPGSKYTFNVTSEIDSLNSEISTVTVYSDPNQPQNLSGSSVSTSSINVSWQAPNDPNAKSYEYNVTWIYQSKSNSTKTSNTSWVIEGLEAGLQYSVTICSLISDTSSEPSTISLLTDPNKIESPLIGNITNSSVIFTWTWPESGVTGIEIKSTTANTASFENITDKSITEYEMKDLIPGNFYEFMLRSYKNSDDGNPSGARIHRRAATTAVKTTYSEPTTRTVQIVPATVSEISCSKVGGGYAIIVSFKCPPGNVSELNVLVNGGTSEPLTNCSVSGDVTVRNLQPANGYDVKVQTVTMPIKVDSVIIRCRTDDVGVIVGAIFGVLLFLLLVGLIAYCILKKRRSKKPEIEIPDVKKQRRFRTLAKEQFADYFQQQHANSDFGFAEEYQELGSVGTKQSKREAELQENRSKNRFTNVLPYDHSRVKLDSIDGIENSDYVNANYMPGYNATKEFIASQGPLPNTNPDFWRMIWEHHVNTIVMLTNCMENGRTKCEHYWPLDYTPCTYGDITVTVTSETILTEWTIRDFSLKHAHQQDVKQVRHFHFTVWPDHGVPENTTDIIQFRSLVRQQMDQQKSNGPTVVHCSAGVGRTGTLIALDYLIQQMEKENRISAYGIVEKMRMNRPLMVQTESQYVFLNKCMLSLIEQPAEENIYENQGDNLIYENATAIRNFQNDKV